MAKPNETPYTKINKTKIFTVKTRKKSLRLAVEKKNVYRGRHI